MKSTLNLVFIAGLFVFLSCQHSKNGEEELTKYDENTETIGVGNDKDDHGCLASAGYTWSEVKQDCIRVFETGLKMSSEKNQNATSAAYLVFSNDSASVELFMPEISNNPVLHREGGGKVWFKSDNSDLNSKEYKVSKSDFGFVILENNDVIYKQDPATL